MNTKEQFDVIKGAIREHVPKLAEFIDLQTPIEEYSASLFGAQVEQKYLSRQAIIKELIVKQCQELFGDEAKNFRLNLDGPVIANIVDHNGILNNPILLSSHIITSASNIFDSKFDILSLNTALYPLNNPFYKRGLGYKEEVIPFISKSKSHQLVYCAPPLEFQEFPKEIQDILTKADEVKSTYAWQQASRMNYCLWPKLFEESLRPRLPRLITLNQDEIVKDLVIKLIKEKGNFVYDTIFKPDFRESVKKVFEGSTGAWDSAGKGSFLFWAIDEKNQALALKQEGDELVSARAEKAYRLPLQEKEIIQALEAREIYPGMVVLFGALLFYAGIVPLAGYGSINYLNVMKERWLKVLENTYPEEWVSINKMPINKLVGGPVLTYYKDAQSEIHQAYMLDILMSGGLKRDYLEKVFAMTFGDLLQAPLIDIYDSYIPKEYKQDITLKPHDIISEQFGWL